MLVILIMAFTATSIQAQSGKSLFLGAQPSLGIQKNSEFGKVHLMAPAIVLQAGISEVIHLRLSSYLNVNAKNLQELRQFGIEVGMPIYMAGKKEKAASGFFLAPVGAYSQDADSRDRDYKVAVEPGYTLYFASGFTMNLGLQVGSIYTTSEGSSVERRNHNKVIFSLGYTFK